MGTEPTSTPRPVHKARLWRGRARGSSRWAQVLVAAVVCAVCGTSALAQDDAGGGMSAAQLDAMSRDIEDALGIYIIHKDKREALEKVLVKENRAEVWFLQPLGEDAETSKCNALRWLFLGRMEGDKGILPIFRKYASLGQVTLVFYSVSTKVRSNRKGGYIQDRTPVRHLELTLDRERALALDPKALQSVLGRSRGVCVDQGEKLVNAHWYIK